MDSNQGLDRLPPLASLTPPAPLQEQGGPLKTRTPAHANPACLHTLPTGPICLASGTMPPQHPAQCPSAAPGPRLERGVSSGSCGPRDGEACAAHSCSGPPVPSVRTGARSQRRNPSSRPLLSPPGPLPGPASVRLTEFEPVTVVQAPNPQAPPHPAGSLLLAARVQMWREMTLPGRGHDRSRAGGREGCPQTAAPRVPVPSPPLPPPPPVLWGRGMSPKPRNGT